MQRGVRIVPLFEAGVREVAERMRASDMEEVLAVAPEGGETPDAIARDALARSRWGAVVLVDGRPEVATGAMECWPGTVLVWLLATDEWARCWRATLRWLREHIPATMAAHGVGCAFVFAADGRPEVGRLLRGVGFVRRGVVPKFGRGQAFALWSRTGAG